MGELMLEELERVGLTPEWVKQVVREAAESMGPENALNHYVTTERMAMSLALHPDTVRRYCREGKIRCVRLGRKYRIKWLDLQKFLAEREVARDGNGLGV